MNDWKLWFVQLSGWPAFLATATVVVLVSLSLSVVMTWLSNRSVTQNAVLAVVVLLVGGGVMLGILAWLSRV